MKISLTLILISISISCFSQSAIFGIKGGINVTTLGGEAENANLKIGFNAGIFSEKLISNQIFLRPELTFSLQGTKSSSDIKFNYSYIHFPLLLRIKLTNDQASLFIGPQMGVLFKANVKDGRQEENITAYLNNLDFSIAFGVGGVFNEKAAWNFRLIHSLNSTAKPVGDVPFIPNIVFQLSFSKIINQ
jgi:hypothetical protein